MEENSKKIDDLFKEELGSYTETPPPAVWGRLEKRLGAVPPPPGRSYRWLSYFGMISVVLLLSVTVAWQISGNTNPGAKKIASNVL